MKKIFNAAILGVGVLALTACNDWLDTTSNSLLTEEALYQSPSDVKLAVNGLYADLCTDPYIQLQTIHQGAGTDTELIDGIGSTSTNQNSERDGMNYNASTSWAKIGTLWEDQYKTIEDCNRIVDGIENSGLSDNDEMRVCSAEARVIRAMVYLDLIRVFGDIPFMWHGAQSDLSNVNIGKTDRDDILDALIDDLENVVTENKLPWCGTVTSEHVNMGFAQGLLANIYMTRAGFAIRENENSRAVEGGYSSQKKIADNYTDVDPYDWAGVYGKDDRNGKTYSDATFKTLRPSDENCKKYYTRANELLESVIKSGHHKMNVSFANLWDNVNKLQLDNSWENMFEIPMGYGIAGELGYTVGVRMNGVTTDYGYGNSAGKLKTTASMLYSYSPCDTRRDITCIAFELKNLDRTTTAATKDSVEYNGKKIAVATEKGSAVTIESLVKNKPFALYIGKWDVRKMSDKWKSQNLTASAKFGYGINTIKMRYPQILLWKAECENYLNGPENAKQYLIEVHSRAYNDAVANYQGVDPQTELNAYIAKILAISDKTEFLKAISDENKLEFCGECFRKWDLIRWNTLHDAIEAAKIDYCTKQRDKVFQEKVYFKYLNYGIGVDEEGNTVYNAPEKSIDWSSATWYGTDADNTGVGTAPGKDWINEHDYRYAGTADKGYDYPGFGASNKDLNGQSYAFDAFGKDYSSLSDLSTICSGLVGTCDTSKGICDDSQIKVKNRYIMPIYTNVVSSTYNSDGTTRVYNSYGY